MTSFARPARNRRNRYGPKLSLRSGTMSHGSGPARRGTKFAMKTIVVDAVPVSS
jgi:hypothetical protein